MHPIPTGKITPNVIAVKTITVNFYIYLCAAGPICFDAGYDRPLIMNQLRQLGIDPLQITHLFLTHSDIDHVHGLPVFKNAQIYLSVDEEKMITHQRARALGFIYNPAIKRPYQLLHDDEVVDLGESKIRAIATPGHTPGSMSYLVDDTILITGDAFKLIDNRAFPIRRLFSMDTEQQKASIRKLAQLDGVQLACTAHRGYTSDFVQAMQDWK